VIFNNLKIIPYKSIGLKIQPMRSLYYLILQEEHICND